MSEEQLKIEVDRLKSNIEAIKEIDLESLKDQLDSELLEQISATKENLFSNMDSVSSSIENIVDNLDESSITQAVASIEEKIPEQLENFYDKFKETIETTTDDLESNLEAVSSEVTNQVEQLHSTITDIFVNANSERLTRVENVETLINQIEHKLTQLIQRVENTGEEFKSMREIVEDGVKSASVGVDGVAIALEQTQETMRSLTGI